MYGERGGWKLYSKATKGVILQPRLQRGREEAEESDQAHWDLDLKL